MSVPTTQNLYLYKNIDIHKMMKNPANSSSNTTGYPNFYTGATQIAVSLGNDARFGNPSPFSMVDKTSSDMSTYYSAYYNEHNTATPTGPGVIAPPIPVPNEINVTGVTAYIRSVLIGAGGGGGGGGGGGFWNPANNPPRQQTGGGGGGGGGGGISYVNKFQYNPTITNSFFVGRGGTGGAGSGDDAPPGATGGQTYFDIGPNSTRVIAFGGLGGKGGQGGSNNSQTNGAGGVGGTGGIGNSTKGNDGLPGPGGTLPGGGGTINTTTTSTLFSFPVSSNTNVGRGGTGGNGGNGTGSGNAGSTGGDGYVRIYYVYE